MAKKFKNTKCIHCLKEFEKLTSDHIFPKSWYPSTTPNDIERWQAPCCKECNQFYSKIENDLLQRFGMCVNPDLEATSGIAEKIMRSYNACHAKSERDATLRLKTKEKLISCIVPREQIKENSLLPSKQPMPDTLFGILIPVDEFKKMAEKLIRGITYVINSTYIDSLHKINIHFQHELDVSCIHKLLKQYGQIYSCGKGISIQRAGCPEDIQSGVFYITIWETLYMYGIVEPLNKNS